MDVIAQHEAGRRVNKQLPRMLHSRQILRPFELLLRKYVAEYIAAKAGVSGVTARRYLTRHVAEGRILEIKPRRDWRVDLPDGEDLPTLYAIPVSPFAYTLRPNAPNSRGANQTSFVITPDDLQILLTDLRARSGLPQRAPGDPYLYRPDQDRMVSAEAYEEMVKEVMAQCSIDRAQACVTVGAILKPLRLLPSTDG